MVVNNMATLSLPPAYRQIQYNPLCVLTYSNDTVLPEYWEDVSKPAFSLVHAGITVLINGHSEIRTVNLHAKDSCPVPQRSIFHS